MTHDELVIMRGNASGQTGSLPPAKAIKVNESKMTHDELLEAVKDNPTTLAVVELHKPEWVLLKIILPGTKPDPIAICSHCSDDQWRKSYPCDTIQAIEKELG